MKQAISLLLALALVLSLGLVTGLPVMAGSTTWYVVEGGTGNQTGQDWDHAFGTIQAGINASGSDDTVMVGAGTYAEAVVIDKTLTLLGAKHGEDARTRDTASGESIIQVPNPDDDSAFAIAADGVTVDGFQIADARVGVHVNAVDVAAVVVRNTHVQNAGQDGINLWRATTAVVEYNLVQNAETSGITGGRTTSDWTGALQVTIRNNEVVNAQYGITGFLKDSVIKGNLVMDYEYEGAGIGGQFLNTMIEDNTVSGYSWGVGVGFRAYPPRPSSEKVRVEGNTLTENYAGIYVHESQTIVEITVNFNDIADNIVGGVVNEAAETLNVRYNWWGHETGPDHDGLNLGGQGDAVSDDVHIGPWLYRPQEQFVSDAPCYAGSVLLANEATKATADNATSYYGGWNSFSTPVTLDSSANRVSDLLDLAEENGLSIVRAQRFDAETQSWVAIIMDDEGLGASMPRLSRGLRS